MVLARDQNCELQIGGSDQWGNITAGIELTRKKLGKQVFGLTLPLITNADGTKFGKTESGAIWLDPKKTSVYKFYQFWINTADADVIRYLKFFTLQRSSAEIDALAQKHQKNPEAREAHRALASEMTYLIHGEDALHKAQIASAVLFGAGGDILSSTVNFFEDIDGEVPTQKIEKSKLDGAGLPLIELVVETGLCPSKGQARKDIEAGGIYVNNQRERELTRVITVKDLIHGHVLLRKGKKNYVSVTAN
jgi:tyrosyl-tRNA synthetase